MSYSVRYHDVISEKAKEDLGAFGFKKVDKGDSDIVIVRSKKLHEDPNVGNSLCVARAGIGTGNVPCKKLGEAGVPVFFAPGGNADSVVETVIGKIIEGAKNFHQSVNFVKNSEKTQKELESVKKQFKGLQLKGKSICIIGLGMIGARLAYHLTELGMKVYGKDLKIDMPFLKAVLCRHDLGCKFYNSILKGDGKVSVSEKYRDIKEGQILITSDYKNVIKNVDFITIHCGFWGKPEFDKNFFGQCKKGITIINCDRGELIVEEDMLNALEDKTVRSYHSDFAPLNKKLRGHKNCIATPHTAATTQSAQDLCGKMVVNSVLHYLFDGNVINAKNFPLVNKKREGMSRICIAKDGEIKMDEVKNAIVGMGLKVVGMGYGMTRDKKVAYGVIDVKEDCVNSFDKKGLEKFGLKKIRVVGKNKIFEEKKKSGKKKKIYNFYAGPGILPKQVVDSLCDKLTNWGGTGLSIAESSHRTPICSNMVQETEDLITKLLKIPKDKYKVLFIQGGATMQFTMIPMNLSTKGDKIGFFETGTWSSKAYNDAKVLEGLGYGSPVLLKSYKKEGYAQLPDDVAIPQDLKYMYFCANETIHGLEWQEWPDSGKVPLVVDVSSNFCSRPIPWEKRNIGLVYAGAQKNSGMAGVCIVIVRKDLVNKDAKLPLYLKYQNHVDKDSMYNTPPVVAIASVNLMMNWLDKLGGVGFIEDRNIKKSDILYDLMDESGGFYIPRVKEKKYRSRMNVSFNLKTKELEAKFQKEAGLMDFKGLKGHRTLGGARASIYNAMDLEGVKALAEFMVEFMKRNK